MSGAFFFSHPVYLRFKSKISNAVRNTQVALCGSLYPQPIKNYKSESINFVIEWIGSPLAAEYLEIVIPALRQLFKEFRLKLLLIGSGTKAWDGIQVEVHPWDEEIERELLLKCDIGIVITSENF